MCTGRGGSVKIVESQDVFCMALPEDVDPTDAATMEWLPSMLNHQATRWISAQWEGAGPAPIGVQLTRTDWLITDKVFEVDEFQPAHDCEECRSGNEKAKAFLRANPGAFLAMANLWYAEVWNS
jgi:hypothetical protein